MKKLLNPMVSLVAFTFVVLLTWGISPVLAQQSIQGPNLGQAAERKDMELVGYNDLQARSAYQPLVHRYGNRWILFVGHHQLDKNPVTGRALPSFNPLTNKNEENGTSIVDVTDPHRPVYLAHIPVANGKGGGAQMVRVCDGSTLPVHDNKVYMLRPYANTAQELWDVTDPSQPKPILTVTTQNPILSDLTGTHKSWWECDTGIAYIVGSAPKTNPSWGRGNITYIYDLSNPSSPAFKRYWALDGQQPGGVRPPNFTAVPAIHGPISTGPAGNRVYFAFGTSSNGVMQIVDRQKLLASAPDDYKAAEIGRLVMNPTWGAHTALPIGNIAVPDLAPNPGNQRQFVVVTSEETSNGCTGPRNVTAMVDVTTESRPQSVANFQVPEASGHFCDRGGRFGPHSTNENFGPPFYQKLIFITYFNAGVRAVDIRDPFNPKEVAYFVPATTENTDVRCATIKGAQNCKAAIQSNNVDTDERGYIYIVDRADTGLHILQLGGDARKNFLGN
jgi:hypothetical protein